MRATVLLALAATTILVGCGKSFSARESAGKGNTLRWPIQDLAALDPALCRDVYSSDTINLVFEGLARFSDKGLPEPSLAESWTISPDGKTYTFHLRKGVKFHSGKELKASDVKYSLDRAANSRLASPTVQTYLESIDGLDDCVHGKATAVSGVKVIDDSTLTIQIEKPEPYFICDLAYPVAYVVDPSVTKPDQPISGVKEMSGTGAYQADTYHSDQIITFRAFESYWGGSPGIAAIERPIVKDPSTRLNLFKTGQADLTQLAPQDVPGLQADDKLKNDLSLTPCASTNYVAFNVKSKPFDNPLVRKAFALAIDRQKIGTEILGPATSPLSDILPGGVPGHRDLHDNFDPVAARQALAQAGYPNPAKFPRVELSYSPITPESQLASDAIATELRQNLGIKVSGHEYPWPTFLELQNGKKLDFYELGWVADYLDPQDFVSTLLAGYSNENKLNYANPKFDALCSQADIMMGHEQDRIRLYQQAVDIALADYVFVPIWQEKICYLVTPRLKGLQVSPLGVVPPRSATLSAASP